jgi:hypothetical protein
MSKNHEDQSLVVRFYHIRDDDKKPIVTVCVVYSKSSGHTRRGVALCSYKDQPNKRIGRDIAFGRAFASTTLTDNYKIKRGDIREEAKKFLLENNITLKSDHCPKLTDYEMRLIHKP